MRSGNYLVLTLYTAVTRHTISRIPSIQHSLIGEQSVVSRLSWLTRNTVSLWGYHAFIRSTGPTRLQFTSYHRPS
jgi:hypothetical protein